MTTEATPLLQINKYALKIQEWRLGRGFYTPSNLEDQSDRDLMLGKLMLVVTEVAEAAEAVRHNDYPNFKEELADAFIRLMDITAACSIDIETEIAEKMVANWQRAIKHGKLCSI